MRCFVSQGNQEHDAFVPGVGREEVNNGIVVERQPRCAEVLRVSCQVDAAGGEAGVKLRGPVTAIAPALQDRRKIRQEQKVGLI